MTCRAYNGRCVLAWLCDALARFYNKRTEPGRLVGRWVTEAVASGQLSEWPEDDLLAPTLHGLILGITHRTIRPEDSII